MLKIQFFNKKTYIIKLLSGSGASTHDATASWVEDVTPNSFKACVMEAGRSTKAQAPHINWFAYQGKLDKVCFQVISMFFYKNIGTEYS